MYKKHFLVVVALLFLSYLANLIYLKTIFHNPKGGASWVDRIYQVKEKYASSIEGPKIVVVAGSSSHFGVSAKLMEKELKCPVVNMGSHADLRDYCFERAKRTLRRGDLVVYAPEYSQYYWDSPSSRMKSNYLINYDKAYLHEMPACEQFDIFKSQLNPWSLFSSEVLRMFSPAKYSSSGYSSTTLNINGDEIRNKGTKNKVINPVVFKPGFNSNSYVTRKMVDFTEWCQQNGIILVVTWPGTLDPQVSHNQTISLFLDNLITFWNKQKTPILGRPQNFFYERKYFYDTNYHLNRKGTNRRTHFVINMLKKHRVFRRWYSDNKQSIDSTVVKDILWRNVVSPSINMKEMNIKWTPLADKKGRILKFDPDEFIAGDCSLSIVNEIDNISRWNGRKVIFEAPADSIRIGCSSKSLNVSSGGSYSLTYKVFFEDGGDRWESLGFDSGTHDWCNKEITKRYNVPVVAVQLFCTLYNSTGQVWFDNIVVDVK